MDSSNPATPRSASPKPRLGRIIVLSILLVVVLLVAGLARWGRKPEPDQGETDPRLTYPTPYRNVRPEVKYVEDKVCADCHPSQAETFQHHPMGRSLSPVSRIASEEHYGRETHNPFEKLGYFFQVSERNGKVYHRQQRKDAKGNVITEHEDEVQFVLGSGSQGRSYLINREGYLFQSPISWFSQEKTWDLSPGFPEHLLSGRLIRAACLVCHCNRALPVRDTENRYHPPIFEGYGIGCQRCHGPGELHVLRRQSGDVAEDEDVDDTIVNPARLEPALREAVCQQCHLLGSVRIQRRQREVFDFRPGLPLFLFRSVFVSAAEMNDTHQAVGHVDQMYASRCFQASKGKLGCISCHDPHRLPAPEEKVKFYRDRCLKCHKLTPTDQRLAPSCALPETRRRQQSKEESCIQCHMTRFANAMIAHTASTDHRILRKPEKAEPHSSEAMNSEASPLANFYRDLLDPEDKEADRDLALALVQHATNDANLGQRPLELALPLLEKALQAHPDDLPAWEAKADALWPLKRHLEALATIEKAVDIAPTNESTLAIAGSYAEELFHDQAALDYWRRAVALSPWRPTYRVHVAGLLTKHAKWSEGAEECRVILDLEPANVECRLLLVRCLLQSGKREQAGQEFDIALRLNSKKAERFRRWFNE